MKKIIKTVVTIVCLAAIILFGLDPFDLTRKILR